MQRVKVNEYVMLVQIHDVHRESANTNVHDPVDPFPLRKKTTVKKKQKKTNITKNKKIY